MTQLFIERRGNGPRVLLVHGSVSGGAATWKAQQPLEDRFELLVLERRGFGGSPPVDREDFEVDAVDIAEALGDGAHLVAHSYGGVGALLAAAAHPERVHSLTLVEPMAYSVAEQHEPVRRAIDDIARYFSDHAGSSPREFLVGFFEQMGLPNALPDPLPERLDQATRLLMRCRGPWTARFPLEALARAPFATLVVSGGHSPAFETICDVLADRLGGERAQIAGAGHAVPRAGAAFNALVSRFLDARTGGEAGVPGRQSAG